MAKFNIFKIDETKRDEFVLKFYKDTKHKEIEFGGGQYDVFLWENIDPGKTGLNWQFVLNEFGYNTVLLQKQPKGFVSIEYNNNIYVASFGNSYFLIEKYCDKTFAFAVARKFEYEKIKSTSIANPNSNKNKVISSYIDSDYFEYDGGSAFLKVKAKLKLEDGFDLFEKSIEIGTSIKLTTTKASLKGFIEIVRYLDEMSGQLDKTHIPIFQEIKDKNKIDELNDKLKSNIDIDNFNLTFSDFDIIGTNEVFYSQATQFRISYKRYYKDFDYLNMDEIKSFCEEKSLELKEVIFDLNIKIIGEEYDANCYQLIDFLDYTDDDEKAVIIRGKWYKYNDDYIQNLHESLKDVACRYDSRFNLKQEEYDAYIEEQLVIQKQLPENSCTNDEELRKKLKKKYYQERFYNKNMERKYQFENGDRSLVKLDGSRIELDDLYKDSTLYAVKIGNSSGKLCYVVDQMDLAMKLLKNKTIPFDKDVKTVVLVLILEQKDGYPLEDGNFNISEIKYLALKNAINNWQKNARLLCFEPRIIIGYNINQR